MMEEWFPEIIIDRIDDYLKDYFLTQWQVVINQVNQQYRKNYYAITYETFHKNRTKQRSIIFCGLQVCGIRAIRGFNYRTTIVSDINLNYIYHIDISKIDGENKVTMTDYLLPNNYGPLERGGGPYWNFNF